jgi:hypothetical protein
MQSRFHGKKPYERPTCTRMSLSEIAAFVRGKTQAHEIQPGDNRLSALAEIPLLFVQNYEGDLNFIRPAVRAPARELEPFAIAKGVGWSEIEFIDAKRVEQQDTFLLLDLRNRHRGERRFLDSIGQDQHLNKALPRVILATSPEDFPGWKGVIPKQCWQLRSCQTSGDLSAAIRSFLRLCTMIAKGPDEENAALDMGRDHALSGRTHKD